MVCVLGRGRERARKQEERRPKGPGGNGPSLHPVLELQRTVGNEATKAAVANKNLSSGGYAWAGGVMSGGRGRTAALAAAFGGAPSGVHAMEQVIHDAGDEWAAVKARHVEDEAVMRNVVAYRKSFVDGLISELRNDRRFRDMKLRAAGSTAL